MIINIRILCAKNVKITKNLTYSHLAILLVFAFTTREIVIYILYLFISLVTHIIIINKYKLLDKINAPLVLLLIILIKQFSIMFFVNIFKLW